MSNCLGGNLNTTHLSQQTSHFEIGEQFAKLYKCQWKDAYSAIETLYGRDIQEQSITKLLLDSLEVIFTIISKITIHLSTKYFFFNILTSSFLFWSYV